MNNLPFIETLSGDGTTVEALKALGKLADTCMSANLEFDQNTPTKAEMVSKLQSLDWSKCNEDIFLLKLTFEGVMGSPVQIPTLLDQDQIKFFGDLGITTYIKRPGDELLMAYGSKIDKSYRLESLADVTTDAHRLRQIKLASRLASITATSTTSQNNTITAPATRNELHQASSMLDRMSLHKLDSPNVPIYKLSGKDFLTVLNEGDDLLGAAAHLEHLIKANGGPKNKIHAGAMNWLKSAASSTRDTWMTASGVIRSHIASGCVAKGNQIVHASSCTDPDRRGIDLEAFFRTEAEELLRALSFAADVILAKTVTRKNDLPRITGATKNTVWTHSSKDSNAK